MANALITTLGSGGDLNVDVTKYRVFTAEIKLNNTASYTTIFSDVSWTWAKVIAKFSNSGLMTFPGAPSILLSSNTDLGLTLSTTHYSSTPSNLNVSLAVSATSTSLAVKSSTTGNSNSLNLFIMIPES